MKGEGAQPGSACEPACQSGGPGLSEMPPKPRSAKVTFVTTKPSGNISMQKRKKRNSGEQTSRKRARPSSPEGAVKRLMKGKNSGPLQAEVLQLVESCINTAMLSVLSNKKGATFESVQGHLSVLKKRLLQLCKDMRVPATKLGKLKNLEGEIQEEKRKMAEYRETLELLNKDLEEAVEAANKMEESTTELEEKMETLREQAADTSPLLEETLLNTDPLQLPQTTFQAPTMQDRVRRLQNPELILKELTGVQENPVYKNLQTLLPMCYTEVSTL